MLLEVANEMAGFDDIALKDSKLKECEGYKLK